MIIDTIKQNICYTDLVYDRIRKKLAIQLSNNEIEKMMMKIVSDDQSTLEKRGKNFYITSLSMNVVVTVNSNNYRVITASRAI